MPKNMLGSGARREVCGPLKDFLSRLEGEDGEYWMEAFKRFLRKEEKPFQPVSVLDSLVRNTEKLLSKRFGKKIKVDPVPEEFTEENLAKWKKYNLKPIFLPDEEILQDRKLKNWVEPETWFYQKIKEGKVAADSAVLKRGWYLADFSIGVDYTDGTQVFLNDPLAPIIERLRKDGKVGKYDKTLIGSRFSIVPENEWPIVVAALVDELGIRSCKEKRIERCIEFNAIGNLYDKNRGRFNMWEWFSDSFEGSGRLCGGRRGSGGLADVGCTLASRRDDDVAARPLVSF